MQTEGAIALQNMIANPDIGFAYLADEVGMGKTYVALGVVAILRYFNPMLRVLYICPSRNILDKWIREYISFIQNNVNFSQGRLRKIDGRPAVPYVSCRNVEDLLLSATSGYFADYFIGKSSFSISLSDEEPAWEEKLNRLRKLVPAYESESIIESKYDVKEQYARALNYALPKFDLVVIDEAHNFKHNFESSDRNRVLSGVLGFRSLDIYQRKVEHALLLSATPYDRDLNQLRNQLNLVGHSNLLPEEIDDEDQELVRSKLKRFMVRRLNTLRVDKDQLTRNMYRREWRKGENAEITLETDEQKLVTALVQKKVGETLTRQSSSPSFQVGLLASFESFAETAKSPPVEFDGDQTNAQKNDAKDKHVVANISESFVDAELGRTLPHPKMDHVTKKLASTMFEKAKKQLVFVRRVKSVKEIKHKLDDAYNEWIQKHINQVLQGNVAARKLMESIYQIYCEASKFQDDGLIGGEVAVDEEDPFESLPAKNDTFFAWFFRGKIAKDVSPALTIDRGEFQIPDSVRKGLISKNQAVVTLLEPNWAWYICEQEQLDLNEIIKIHGERIVAEAGHYTHGSSSEDQLVLYQSCQIAFIKWLIDHGERNFPHLQPLYDQLTEVYEGFPADKISKDQLSNQLTTETLYTELEAQQLADVVIPHQSHLYKALLEMDLEGSKPLPEQFELFDIHKSLMSFVLRTSHGIIDLYLARLKQGPENLTSKSRTQWVKDFVEILKSQQSKDSFSTYCQLTELAKHLELIIKNNIPKIYELNRDEYPRYLSENLNPVSPVIGASGATSGRSSQARKFRMPGYPLALISTDVFQEGEDLHLFCDSVVHYGLSGTPVGLEQKVGRVDRVNSMAQRRLTSLGRPAEKEEFIQVNFPYVKESIETLQMRHVCRNYNEFIQSLHEIVSDENTGNDVVDLEEEYSSRKEVPEQILCKLESPFIPKLEQNKQYCLTEIIEDNERNHFEKVRNASNLLNNELGDKSPSDCSSYYCRDGYKLPDSDLTIKLDSAKASGELVLSLTRPANPPEVEIQNIQELRELMLKISWHTFHRTFAINSSKSKSHYQLYFNAEMIMGNSRDTQKDDIARLFERMHIEHDPDSYQSELPCEIRTHVDFVSDENMRISIDRTGNTHVHVDKINNITKLKFDFSESHIDRSQKVSLYVCGEMCVFLSVVTHADFAETLSVSNLIRHTWIRNRHTDLVEFVLDRDCAIVGRIVHPFKNMQWNEFIFCAYTLAVETDRLEYLLNKSDVH